jgi:hypothetical protein
MVSMLLILFLLHFQPPDWFDCHMLPWESHKINLQWA